jgi:anti-anti-sigma regulatory factor
MQQAGCTNRCSHTRVRSIDIDASDVNRVGAQCIQVLLAAAKSWRAEDQHFKVEKPLRSSSKRCNY